MSFQEPAGGGEDSAKSIYYFCSHGFWGMASGNIYGGEGKWRLGLPRPVPQIPAQQAFSVAVLQKGTPLISVPGNQV